jgi:2'-5' RNA ligase
MGGICSGGRNSFALVGYLPEPLAGFVDRLRNDLKPGCRLRAHITLLPPRPLICSPESAWRELQGRLKESAGFPVELEDVRQFQESGVIYIALASGFAEMERLHRDLNAGSCKFSEVWSYHPHITLAQGLPPSRMASGLDLATRRWSEFQGSRRFLLERVTFVQNVADDESEDKWADLETVELRPAVAV